MALRLVQNTGSRSSTANTGGISNSMDLKSPRLNPNLRILLPVSISLKALHGCAKQQPRVSRDRQVKSQSSWNQSQSPYRLSETEQ